MENTIEIYDSNLEVKEGEDPHKVMLENMVGHYVTSSISDFLILIFFLIVYLGCLTQILFIHEISQQIAGQQSPKIIE